MLEPFCSTRRKLGDGVIEKRSLVVQVGNLEMGFIPRSVTCMKRYPKVPKSGALGVRSIFFFGTL